MTEDTPPAWYSSNLKAKVTRQMVRALVPCPECGAEARQRCIGSRGQVRYAMHQERWDLYREYRDRSSTH